MSSPELATTKHTAALHSAATPISRGRRNLLLLGAIAIAIALLTTSLELVIYRHSGDIYLDRSRPGFLPDEEEAAAEHAEATPTTYTYPDTGQLSASELDEYLRELQAIQDSLKNISSPYQPTPLTDEALGITLPAPDNKPDTPSKTK